MRALLVTLAVGAAGCAQLFDLDPPVPANDAASGDGSSDAPGDGRDGPIEAGCPMGFGPIPGSAHLYLLVSVAENWAGQQAKCRSLSSSAYLAVPDSASELMELDGLAAQTTHYWIGVSDQQTEGTYVTVLATLATYLPWQSGQPDDAAPGGEDCVSEDPTRHAFSDDRCNMALAAVCECEPGA